MAKNYISLQHTYYHVIQNIITGADVIDPNMDFSWTECLYVDGSEIKCAVLKRFDIHVSVHRDVIYENDQQDATV
jgi:hypothetical protein